MICNNDNKLIICTLFLDLSKAFDCVDHKILLEKLFYYGVKGTPLKLLASYLDNRFQCTKIGDTKSYFFNVTCGMAQGSVVGSLLFLIYINDIVKASNFNTVLYADDINLHISGKNHEILEKTVNHELKKIDHWLRANKLCINYSKSNFMLMNNHKNINFSVSINHHPIPKQSILKYLGVILDDKLNWKPQIEKLVTQLSKSCGILFKLTHYTNISVLKSVYFALFHSYSTYSILNWGRANKMTLLPLIRLQNKAVRTLEYNKTKTTVLYSKHIILEIPDLFQLSVAKFMYSFNNCWLPNHFDNCFAEIASVHKYQTRPASLQKYYLPRMKTSLGQLALKYIGPKIWSNIPEKLKSSSPYSIGKKYKKVLQSCQISCWSSFYMLVTFCNIVLMPLFSLLSTSIVVHPTPCT